jgi:hypothetical protein
MNMNECEILRVVKRKMARESLLTGTAGGMMGAAAGGIGVIWSMLDMLYVMEIVRAMNDPLLLILTFFRYSPYLSFIYGSTLMPINGLYFTFSMMLAVLLFVGGVLTGIGFYGVHKAGGGAMGLAGLAFGTIGGLAGSTFLILGNMMPVSFTLTIFVTISVPSYLFIFIGFVILGGSLIVMGVSSIAVREVTVHSSAAAAAGVLSIIGGCFLSLYILDWLVLSIIGGIMALIGFILILSAFIIWSAVFYGSRNI